MVLSIHYLAQLKRLAGVSSERLEVPEAFSLAQILNRLARDRDAGFRNIVLDPQHNPHPSLLVFVNDDQVGPSAALKDGDRVTLLTPMAGG